VRQLTVLDPVEVVHRNHEPTLTGRDTEKFPRVGACDFGPHRCPTGAADDVVYGEFRVREGVAKSLHNGLDAFRTGLLTRR